LCRIDDSTAPNDRGLTRKPHLRFNKLDLNLLVALDVLLKERSVTRAAEQLSLSPSAMSNSLARLREYFDDELLVQIGRKMEITPRAEVLSEVVRDVLLQIDSRIAAQPEFDPRRSDRTFRIFASDYTQLVFAPTLLALAGQAGSTVRLHFLPQVSQPVRDLDRGEADLLIIPSSFNSPDHPQEELYREEFVCLVSRNSKMAQGELTFDRYVQAEHVVMRPPLAEADSFEGWFLRRFGVTRRVAVTTYSFVVLPGLVVGTELVTTVHARLARRMVQAWPLEIRPTPVPIEPMVQTMQWHKFRTKDPGLLWLRGLAAQAARQIDED
jgi:LysR family nod box-dependent transcriptional activator